MPRRAVHPQLFQQQPLNGGTFKLETDSTAFVSTPAAIQTHRLTPFIAILRARLGRCHSSAMRPLGPSLSCAQMPLQSVVPGTTRKRTLGSHSFWCPYDVMFLHALDLTNRIQAAQHDFAQHIDRHAVAKGLPHLLLRSRINQGLYQSVGEPLKTCSFPSR